MPTKNPYSFKVKIVQRAKGQSAVASAAYQAGEKILDERIGRRCNYSKKKGVVHTEILAPPSSPGWAMNRAKLWNSAEAMEKRKDAQIARKFILALPRQLTHEQRVRCAKGFIQEQFVNRGMIADFAVHLPEAGVGKNQDNHHLHLLTTMREVVPEGFAPEKNRAWNKISLLETWRSQWAAHVNRALVAHGFEPTWDHRSLEEQGVDRIPQIHLGQAALEMEARGIQTQKGQRALAVAEANRLNAELQQLEKEIADEQRARTDSKITQPASTNRVLGTATPSRQSTNRLSPETGGGHESRPEKAPAPTQPAKSKIFRPATRPMSPPQTEGEPGMNLSPSEYQDFLRVKRLLAQRQEEEKQQKRLSEEQKKRIEEMIRRTEEAALKRPGSLYWEDYFAMDCMAELRQRRQTVEQADWHGIEGKVIAGLIQDGASTQDAAEVLYEMGVSVKDEKDRAALPDGQTAGERLAMEYLKTLAASNPDLLDAVEQAEKQQEVEASDVQREQIQQAQTAAPQPGA